MGTDREPDRLRFTTTMGDLLASWNLPHVTGRIYGLLLLSGKPLTLDDIATELQVSKASASTGVRQLSSWGLARTLPQGGTRRLLVEAAGGLEDLLVASHARARALISTLREGDTLIDSDRAKARLRDVLGLFETYVQVGDEMIKRHRDSQARS